MEKEGEELEGRREKRKGKRYVIWLSLWTGVDS